MSQEKKKKIFSDLLVKEKLSILRGHLSSSTEVERPSTHTHSQREPIVKKKNVEKMDLACRRKIEKERSFFLFFLDSSYFESIIPNSLAQN